MHAAKGLEFPFVFIVGMEDGLFPLSRAMEDDDELEEERRLAYVGMTRAEKRLFLTATRSRLLYGRYQNNLPSRFIDEIDSDLIDNQSFGSRVYTRPSISEGGVDYPCLSRFNRARSIGGASHSGTAALRSANKAALSNKRPLSAAKTSSSTNEGPVTWKAGDKVQHKAWGVGTVVQVVEDKVETRLPQVLKN